MSNKSELTYEIPSSLKQLARIVVRGFYTIEDALIIDMLVRNPCMKEDDIAELLKFEKKMLRARLTMLKNDKFLQARLKMETAIDGKAHKVNYYFINYKTFVNVIKYKLDLMRKRLETEERDATSRANFKCTNCCKPFTDLEIDQLFDLETGELRCTFCGSSVEEDLSAIPKKDSRLMLARFNEQLQSLYDLLRQVEGIKLAPEVLEPQPIDIDVIRGIIKPNDHPGAEIWSGEATRNGGFAAEDARVDITIGEADTTESTAPKKERPIWMTESTVTTKEESMDTESILEKVAQNSAKTNQWQAPSTAPTKGKKEAEENIMSVLLAHEKQTTKANNDAVKNLNNPDDSSGGDSSNDDDEEIDRTEIPVIDMMNEDEDSEDDVPTVMIGNKPYPVTEVTDNKELIERMTPHEKAQYIQIYQEYYEHLF
ncbi:general transcription factor IIE subunit 1 [Chironomus tepperi]|uniref:general transcription factor IIE subunit 1 n=1 Tax=Chironomus tepperi TaxID=113505 RepID=UPI00391F92ED